MPDHAVTSARLEGPGMPGPMGKGVQPEFTTEDIDTFLTAAVEKLP